MKGVDIRQPAMTGVDTRGHTVMEGVDTRQHNIYCDDMSGH